MFSAILYTANILFKEYDYKLQTSTRPSKCSELLLGINTGIPCFLHFGLLYFTDSAFFIN